MKSFLINIHAVQELDAMSHQEGFWIETDLDFRRCLRNLAAKMELLANFCYLNHSGKAAAACLKHLKLVPMSRAS